MLTYADVCRPVHDKRVCVALVKYEREKNIEIDSSEERGILCMKSKHAFCLLFVCVEYTRIMYVHMYVCLMHLLP
jgi:hypothetical protein